MKAYPCVCQACGKLHTVTASFLSCSRSAVFEGIERLQLSCGQHTSAELKAAYLRPVGVEIARSRKR